MTEERLKQEYLSLTRILKEGKEFRFLDFNTSHPYLFVAQQTNSGKVYTIKVDLSENYPYNIPKVFITHPKPLLTRSGGSMLEPSHTMHTLQGENGCVRVCHYGTQDWHPNVTLYQIIIKVRVWLEMYENHLKTGRPLDYYLTSAAF